MTYNRHRSRIAASMTHNLGEFQKQELYTDVIVNVDSKTYHCHKTVLAAASPFFNKMFMSDFKEKNEGQVKLHEVSCEVFESILSYLYNQGDPVNSTNVHELLKAACMFQMTCIKERCEQFIVAHLTFNNCLSNWKFSCCLSCHTLSSKVFRYILKKFKMFVQSKSFLDIEKQDLIKIISHEHLCVQDENVVAMAVSRWVNFNRETRQVDLEDVLQYIRLPLLTIEQIYHIQTTELPNIEKSLQCMMILDEAKQYQLFPYRRYTFSSVRCTYRAAMGKLTVFPVSVNGVSGNMSFLLYDLAHLKWLTITFGRQLLNFSQLIDIAEEMCLVGKTNSRYSPSLSVYKMNLAIPKGYKEDVPISKALTPHIDEVGVSYNDDHVMHIFEESLFIITSKNKTETIIRYKLKDHATVVVVSLKKCQENLDSKDFTTAAPLKAMSAGSIKNKLYIFGHLLETNVAIIQSLSMQGEKATLLQVTEIPGNPGKVHAIIQDNTIILVCSSGCVLRLAMDEEGHLNIEHVFKIENLGDQFSSGIYQSCLYVATSDQQIRKFDLKNGNLLTTMPIPQKDLTLGLCGMYTASKGEKKQVTSNDQIKAVTSGFPGPLFGVQQTGSVLQTKSLFT